MMGFRFGRFKGAIAQALIAVGGVEIDDFWTLDMSVSTLDVSVSTLDMLLSTLDSRQLPRLLLIDFCLYIYIYIWIYENGAKDLEPYHP